MFYSQDIIDDVRMGNDIVDIIGSYVSLKGNGHSFVGLCPFHKEKTPSFHVNRENQFYHCFGCGASGNVYSFLMQHQNYSFPDAVKFLADRINYTLPEAEYSPDYEYRKQLRERLYKIHNTAARFYYEKLNSTEGKKATEYLDKRLISQKARIKFGLGYSPYSKTALYERLISEGYSDDDILKSGLVIKKDDGTYRDKFYNRLMFPIINVYGKIIGFGGRIIGQGEPKYLNSPATEIFDKSKNLYGLNFARQSKMRELILVEGYMDVISVYQAGFFNVVAALGTAFNDNHAKVLKSYADSVVLLFDSDQAGVNAVLRTIPILNKAGIKVKVLQVTDAKDPDEYIKTFGATAFGRLLNSAKSQYSFLIDNSFKKYDLTKNDDKIAYAKEVAEILSHTEDAIEEDLYTKEASEISGISVQAIKSVIDKLRGRSSSTENKVVNLVNNKPRGVSKGVDDARRSIIRIMTGNPEICFKLNKHLTPEEFVDPFYVKLVGAIFDTIKSGKPVIAANITSIFETFDEQQLATQLFIEKLSFEDSEELIKATNDQLKLVKESYIDEAINGATDADAVNDLLIKKRAVKNLNINN